MNMDTRLDCMETMEVKGKNVDYKVTNVGPVIGGEGFLFVSENTTFLLDNGFAFCAEQMVENIRKVLGDRKLDYILLTHSHYDHLSGTPYITRAYPDVKVVANDHTANVIVRDGAKKVMRRMNEAARETYDRHMAEFGTHEPAIERYYDHFMARHALNTIFNTTSSFDQ